MKRASIVILIVLVFLIFYLSWFPESRLESIWFIPKFLSKWADMPENENLRTAVPFAILSFFTGVYLVYKKSKWHWWLCALAIQFIIVTVAEAGQLYIPNRSFDTGDILFGSIGAIAGEIIVLICYLVKRTFKIGTSTNKQLLYE